jgi:hypothetical protein
MGLLCLLGNLSVVQRLSALFLLVGRDLVPNSFLTSRPDFAPSNSWFEDYVPPVSSFGENFCSPWRSDVTLDVFILFFICV